MTGAAELCHKWRHPARDVCPSRHDRTGATNATYRPARHAEPWLALHGCLRRAHGVVDLSAIEPSFGGGEDRQTVGAARVAGMELPPLVDLEEARRKYHQANKADKERPQTAR